MTLREIGLLGETEDKSKPKEKRLEETEKLDAETERSLAAARMKEAHKKIEDVEKLRKRPALLSVCKRIDLAMDDLLADTGILNMMRGKVFSETDKIHILNNEQTYKSILTDFQKTLEIKDEDMKKLFPEVEIKKDIAGDTVDSYVWICSQLRQMKVHCQRMLT
jgi:hypothetical protein